VHVSGKVAGESGIRGLIVRADRRERTGGLASYLAALESWQGLGAVHIDGS
jgi:hypothetical protein